MDDHTQRKLVVEQAIIWAICLITMSIVLVVLDNLEGRFTFALVSLANILVLTLFSGLSQRLLRWTLHNVRGDQPGPDEDTVGQSDPKSEHSLS